MERLVYKPCILHHNSSDLLTALTSCLLLALKAHKLTGTLWAVYNVCVNNINPNLHGQFQLLNYLGYPKAISALTLHTMHQGVLILCNTFQLPPPHGSCLLQITRTDQASSSPLCKLTLPPHQRTGTSLQPAPKWKLNSREGVLLGWHAFSRTIMEWKLIHLSLSKLISYYHGLKRRVPWGSMLYQRIYISGALQCKSLQSP